ncbi:hypothetical protein SAMN04488498_101602 [Mesorhizobium albiziae]|uniref:Uncharacterized protein n=1 Tax=Neomesorhizobium albiziae TaxID=335020 RepID=A0A1I3VN04_9HYPH|nr:hypothetical protein SAMN04488498_101602 [Mesorhizobium albiziae]
MSAAWEGGTESATKAARHVAKTSNFMTYTSLSMGRSAWKPAPIAYCIDPLLTMQRNPTWLIDVSTGCAWRAAGR